MDRDPPPVVLHSSIVRLTLTFAAPAMLLGLGVWSLTLRVWLPTVLLTVVGVATAVVVLFDLPVRAEFDRDGVTRVCVLRRQRLPWTRVVALERAMVRPPIRRRSGDAEASTVRQSQGLVARLGPRRVSMLVDRRESRREFEAVGDLLRKRATVMRASPPPLDSVPAGRGQDALHRTTEG